MTYKIEVVPYNPAWPSLFEEEAAKIRQALGSNCIAVHHIGSTAVPGLSAKPIIDMIPVVLDIMRIDQSLPNMRALGYEVKGEFGIPFRRYFQKEDISRTHNVHIFEQGNSEIERHLKFRDWMRTHEGDRNDYGRLKEELALKYPHDMMAYGLGKEAFIAEIDTKTGFKGLRIVKALLPKEWEAARALAHPPTSTFDHKDHVHFVLYQGTKIEGYAHLQLGLEQRAALRIIVIDNSLRGQGLGSQFLTLCERWLKQQGVKTLHAL